MIGNFVVYPKNLLKDWRLTEKVLVFSCLLATSQLPLDWDLETEYQFYPYPILIMLDLSHTFMLVINTIFLL